ncbi:DnaB-like helicase C-terminal domain-containing protein [Cloacibacillus sp. An23]|uniref:DnaB-like helicase C-terminal domain-containing protein n=1 Tax=Cloacibacillus sp. An23 TaxID=1965591 RepID=UPI000B371382|nr:DnaB-like helicase C-terminal domain-containing protein [Cloacibacillus sp. An23]OUO94774.1 hypothetical protein B5F39_02585 [Cloacibacillus sp. An23]
MERPVSPLNIKQAGAKFNRPEAETLEQMCIALGEEAKWWASRGGKPTDIAKQLMTSVRMCGEPPFISAADVSQMAVNAFKALVAERRSMGAKSNDPALTEPNDMRAELKNMEAMIDYRTEQFHFGVHELDDAMGGGVMKGQIMSIIGNPGSMKTSLLLSGIETWVAESPTPVAFFSLDMDKPAIFERLMLREMRCGRHVLVDKYRAGAEEYKAAKERIGRRFSGRMTVLGNTDGPLWTIDTLARYVQFNVPGLLAIDYLTLLKKLGQSDYDTVNESMLMLKDLARQYRTAIVILSQMSMSSRREQAAGGMGGSARGGGIVNELADVEIELYRDMSNDPNDTMPKIIATITKTRSGIAGSSWKLDYNGPMMTFRGTAQRVFRKRKTQVFEDA